MSFTNFYQEYNFLKNIPIIPKSMKIMSILITNLNHLMNRTDVRTYKENNYSILKTHPPPPCPQDRKKWIKNSNISRIFRRQYLLSCYIMWPLSYSLDIIIFHRDPLDCATYCCQKLWSVTEPCASEEYFLLSVVSRRNTMKTF